jgi:hypothetical protein
VNFQRLYYTGEPAGGIVAQSGKFSWHFAKYDCNPSLLKKDLDKVRAEICKFLEPLQEDIRAAGAQLARERALLAKLKDVAVLPQQPDVYLTEEDSFILTALADARPSLLTQEQIERAIPRRRVARARAGAV